MFVRAAQRRVIACKNFTSVTGPPSEPTTEFCSGSLSDVVDHFHQGQPTELPLRTSQCLCQTPTVQWQQHDVQHQYGRQIEYKRIRDEGEVATYGNDAKVDHILHAKCGQHQG
jgi:hypothetical protein